MELNELKNVLSNTTGISGVFNEQDIDYMLNSDDEKHCEYVCVNNVIVPFRRICIGLQDLREKGADTVLLFIFDFKQIQIKIKDIDSLEFYPEFQIY